MRKLRPTTRFKKDIKRAKSRGKDITKLEEIIKKIQTEIPLDPRNNRHRLSGSLAPIGSVISNLTGSSSGTRMRKKSDSSEPALMQTCFASNLGKDRSCQDRSHTLAESGWGAEDHGFPWGEGLC